MSFITLYMRLMDEEENTRHIINMMQHACIYIKKAGRVAMTIAGCSYCDDL